MWYGLGCLQLINISTDELYEYLHEAEEWKQKVSTGLLFERSLPAGVKKRYREATPPEVLREEDERKFRRLEKEARQKWDDSNTIGIWWFQ